MAFPHPEPRKDKYRNEDIPNSGGVVWNFFKRTINIAEYRNGKDHVNPVKNRTLGGVTHHLIPLPSRICCSILGPESCTKLIHFGSEQERLWSVRFVEWHNRGENVLYGRDASAKPGATFLEAGGIS